MPPINQYNQSGMIGSPNANRVIRLIESDDCLVGLSRAFTRKNPYNRAELRSARPWLN